MVDVVTRLGLAYANVLSTTELVIVSIAHAQEAKKRSIIVTSWAVP